MTDHRLARSLGWFSIALGAVELVAPGPLRSWFRSGDERVMRLFGAREGATGLALLVLPDPTPGLWARVGGDALDLVSLGTMLSTRRARRGRVAGAIGVVAAITAVDLVAALRQGRDSGATDRGVFAVERSLTIGRPAADLHTLLRDPRTLARTVGPSATVTVDDDGRQRWEVRPPKGAPLSWTSTVSGEDPGGRITWETVSGPGARAEVRFQPAPGDWGTVMTLRLEADASGGLAPLTGGLGRRLGETGLAQVLHRFKSLAETGEIPTLSGQPAARNDGRDR